MKRDSSREIGWDLCVKVSFSEELIIRFQLLRLSNLYKCDNIKLLKLKENLFSFLGGNKWLYYQCFMEL